MDPAKFENICIKIFEANGYQVSRIEGKDIRIDFTVYREKNEQIAVEVKFYRSSSPLPKLINDALEYFSNAVREGGFAEGILIISTILPEELRARFEEKFGLAIFDRDDLFSMASEDEEIISDLRNILETDIPDFKERKDRLINLLDRAGKQLEETIKTTERKQSPSYCKKLRNLKPGKNTWRQYEDLCKNILEYLFEGYLVGWHSQLRSKDGLNRYDLICRIIGDHQFWNFLALELDSRYILFECKNHRNRIKQGEIYTTERYLLKGGKRSVGFIISRKGPDLSAEKATVGAMRENNKLLIHLDDNDLCKMIELRKAGDDPSNYLFEKVDEFMLGLPR